MSEFQGEKVGNGSDHDRKKQKVVTGDEDGLSSLSEEERALLGW